MPVYSYKCAECHKTFDQFYRLSEHKAQSTCDCGGSASQVIMPGHGGFRIDKGRFFSPVFGREFKNEKDMGDYAKFHGHIPVGDEPVEKIAKLQKQMEKEKQEKLYADLEQTTKMITKDL